MIASAAQSIDSVITSPALASSGSAFLKAPERRTANSTSLSQTASLSIAPAYTGDVYMILPSSTATPVTFATQPEPNLAAALGARSLPSGVAPTKTASREHIS